MVDVHVGARIRIRRKLLGVSQQSLAEALGLTFQQVQKYERGTNRVSASKLFEVANFLEAPVNYFFEELPSPMPEGGAASGSMDEDRAIRDFLLTGEGLELARGFPAIKSSKMRRTILDLVRVAAEDARGGGRRRSGRMS
jgi:transcriptional regulator with XRE-family HTH domain